MHIAVSESKPSGVPWASFPGAGGTSQEEHLRGGLIAPATTAGPDAVTGLHCPPSLNHPRLISSFHRTSSGLGGLWVGALRPPLLRYLTSWSPGTAWAMAAALACPFAIVLKRGVLRGAPQITWVPNMLSLHNLIKTPIFS